VEDSVATTNAAFHMICVFVVVLNQDCGRVLMTFDGYGQCNHPTGVCYPQISAFPWKAHHNLKLRMALKRICMSSMSCLDVVCLKEICSGCRILPPTTLYIGVSIMLRCLYPSMLKWLSSSPSQSPCGLNKDAIDFFWLCPLSASQHIMTVSSCCFLKCNRDSHDTHSFVWLLAKVFSRFSYSYLYPLLGNSWSQWGVMASSHCQWQSDLLQLMLTSLWPHSFLLLCLFWFVQNWHRG